MIERNTEALELVMDQIRSHPETWEQSEWTCGTSACFAGWTGTLLAEQYGFYPTEHCASASHADTYLSKKDVIINAVRYRADTDPIHIQEVATHILGLNGDDANLFNGSNTLRMLELMVKDMCNGEPFRNTVDYSREARENSNG